MSLRALIADPDEMLLATSRAYLAAEEVEVATASNGLDCLAALRQWKPDVLVLDPDLPWGSGMGILARMGEGDVPPVPVVILTARPEKVLEADIPLRDYALLIKPLSAAAVADILRALAESGWRGQARSGVGVA